MNDENTGRIFDSMPTGNARCEVAREALASAAEAIGPSISNVVITPMDASNQASYTIRTDSLPAASQIIAANEVRHTLTLAGGHQVEVAGLRGSTLNGFIDTLRSALAAGAQTFPAQLLAQCHDRLLTLREIVSAPEVDEAYYGQAVKTSMRRAEEAKMREMRERRARAEREQLVQQAVRHNYPHGPVRSAYEAQRNAEADMRERNFIDPGRTERQSQEFAAAERAKLAQYGIRE